MKFTEMNFFEAEVMNTTKKFNDKKINIPLRELLLVDDSGLPRSAGSSIDEKTMEKLEENLITDVKSFEFAYSKGSLKDIISANMVRVIHNSIENSIANLPGIDIKVYNYLKGKGIKTIRGFKEAHNIGEFQDEKITDPSISANDLEDIQILIERKNQPSLIRVYHSSVDINCAEYIFNKSWADGPNSQAYGTGLYTVWTKSSAFDDIDVFGRHSWCPKDFYRDNAVRRGKEYRVDEETGEKINFRFEFLVDVQDYFIGNWGLFNQTHPDVTYPDGKPVNEHNFIDYQNKKYGMNVPTNGDPHAVQSYFWGFWWKNNGKNDKWSYGHSNPHFISESKDGVIKEDGPCVKGIAFVGSNDGDVVVVYDTKRALPIRVSKGDKNKWFYIGGPGILGTAEQALKMGISYSMSGFWKEAEAKYRKSIEDMFENHQGSWDIDETEFINSNGKNVVIVDSVEEGVIEGPEANESNNNGVFDNYKIINCLDATAYHIPLSHVKNIEIWNEVDANCEIITSISGNGTLLVDNTLEMYNCPKATLPWKLFYNKDNTGKAKFENMQLIPGTLIQGFDQVILENMTLSGSIGFVDSGAGSDKSKISLVDVKSPHMYVCMDKVDEVKNLKIIGDSQIDNLHIVTRRPGKSIDRIIISKDCIGHDTKVHFEIQTGKHRSIYKDDDEILKTTYSINELIEILQESTEEKSEIFETLQFKINHIDIV